jgi:uncharacterized OB-fold protein
MKKIESYVKKWYDELEEGKIYGTHCKKCGALEFPPLPICNACGGHDMEWNEINGEGTLITCDDCTQPIWGPDMGPVISGIVELKEGSSVQAFILGVEGEDRISLFDRLPVKVQAEIQQRDGYKYPAFRVDEDQEG